MAVTLDATNITTIDDCENTTNWSSSKSFAADIDNPREGTYSLGMTKVSSETAWIKFDYYTENASTYLDISTGNKHYYLWVAAAQAHLVGGIQLTAEDASGNIGYWNMVTASGQYKGGWKCYVVDTEKAFDSNNGTDPTRTTIRYIGMTITITSKVQGNVYNVWVDYPHYADGPLIVKGGGVGTEGTFAQIYAAAESTTTAYGFIVEQEGSYAIQGPLQFGDNTTASSYFLDANQIVIAADVQVDANWLTISTTGNSTGTNSFVLGEKSGTAGINGCVFKSAGTAKMYFDLTDTNMNYIGTYGCTFIDCATIEYPVTGGTLRESLNSTYIACGAVYPSTMTFKYFSIVYSDSVGISIGSTSHAASDGTLTNTPYGISFTATGTYTLNNVTFSAGTGDIDLLNPNNATQVDANSTNTTNFGMGAGWVYSKAAQSFTGTAGVLSSSLFYLKTTGSPTGNVVSNLYADTGGSGPGTLLATSNDVDITTISSAGFANIYFEFEDEYTLSAATTYWISVEYSGGDISNYLQVGVDGTLTHSGDMYWYTTSWGATGVYDLTFYVNRDGIVKVNANNSNPATDEQTGTPMGATIIVNTVTLTVVCKNEAGIAIEGVNVRIEVASNGNLVSQGATNSSGIYQNTSYNYEGDLAVVVKARKKGYKFNSAQATIESTGLTVPFTMIRDPAVNLP